MGGWLPERNKASALGEPSKNNVQRLRQLADAEWIAARNESLPQRRMQRERSAMRWDEMTEAAEGLAIKTAVNARAKVICSG